MPSITGGANAKAQSTNNAFKAPIDLGTEVNIDWSAHTYFYNTISTDKGYRFSNMTEGRTIMVIVKNTAASAITLTFPTSLTSYITYTVQSSKENVYTMVRLNGKTYITVIDGMA